MSSKNFEDFRKYADELSQALIKVCMKKEGVNCNADLGNNVYAYVKLHYKSYYMCVQMHQFEETGEESLIYVNCPFTLEVIVGLHF